ncbi:MAG: hypothetical protein C6P37_09440 [Caldibacillus debilis]|uniref:Uncharacterized protein n=1 Tax=Caldibacillus debilis TaxID=301148 RepID=A0A3E0K3H9_9BACI|nr:MAG: hypothetical protein C6P37_09440 [Caldibacillus debilis]
MRSMPADEQAALSESGCLPCFRKISVFPTGGFIAFSFPFPPFVDPALIGSAKDDGGRRLIRRIVGSLKEYYKSEYTNLKYLKSVKGRTLSEIVEFIIIKM